MVNRAPDDAWSAGDGYARGASVAKIQSGAKAHGWLVTPAFAKGQPPVTAGALGCAVELGSAFMLEPGDLFVLEPWTLAGHASPGVGVVLEVGTGNGARNVVTVEGCLAVKDGVVDDGVGTGRTEPCARWFTRVFYDDGRFAFPGSDTRLAYVVRPT
jgi:hypothetical protein